ncbi:hypothetical protein FRC07_001499, partial [Ceratobasidium sp. 392]
MHAALASHLVDGVAYDSGDNERALRCQQEEKAIYEQNTPDEVTGRALNWLIKHSKEEDTVHMAIRAIAGAELSKNVSDILAEDSLIALVAQKFTALFRGRLDQETSIPELVTDIPHANTVNEAEEVEEAKEPGGSGVVEKFKQPQKGKEAEQVRELEHEKQLEEKRSLYGRALTNIAKHKRRIDTGIRGEAGLESQPGSTLSTPLTLDQTQAVTRGLYRLLSSESADIAAYGIASISAWYMFTAQARNRWKEILVKSLGIIHNYAEKKTRLHPDALADLMHSLPVQISYWRQDMSRTEKQEVLKPLVRLLRRDNPVEEIREGLSLTLAVLTISVNDYPDVNTDDEVLQWKRTYKAYSELVDTHFAAADKWKHSPSYYGSSLTHHHGAAINRAEWRTWRAQQAAWIYTIYPILRTEHKESLLLIGLAGLLESLGTLCLEVESTHITTAIAHELSKITILNKSQPISIPLVLPLTFDVRTYTVDRIIQSLRPSRSEGNIVMVKDEAKVHLLGAILKQRQLWVDFDAQLVLPVIEMLYTTKNLELQEQCLIALEEHYLTKPSWRESVSIASYPLPDMLLDIVRLAERDSNLRTRAISTFELFSSHVESPKTTSVWPPAPEILRSLILSDLFETL